jgi:hypothetical protein
VTEALQSSKNKNRRILPTKNNKSAKNMRDVEFINQELGNKVSFVRKAKIKKRNTTDEKGFGK